MKKRQSRKLTKWEIALQAECDKLRAQIMHQDATLRAVDEKASACVDAIKGVPITVRDQFDQCVAQQEARKAALPPGGSMLSAVALERLYRIRDALKSKKVREAQTLLAEWLSTVRKAEPGKAFGQP